MHKFTKLNKTKTTFHTHEEKFIFQQNLHFVVTNIKSLKKSARVLKRLGNFGLFSLNFAAKSFKKIKTFKKAEIMPFEVVATIDRAVEVFKDPEVRRFVSEAAKTAAKIGKTAAKMASEVEIDGMETGTLAFIIISGVVVVVLTGALGFFCCKRIQATRQTLTTLTLQNGQRWFSFLRFNRTAFEANQNLENGQPDLLTFDRGDQLTLQELVSSQTGPAQ